jgi:hypothetical protein
MTVEIKKKAKSFNEYSLTMKGFTAGQIMAMKNALELYSSSPVAQDVLDFLKAAIDKDPELAQKIN